MNLSDPARLQAITSATDQWLAGGQHRHCLTWDDPRYPARLKALPDAPMMLFAHGHLECLDTPAIGIVGSRNASQSGVGNAFELAVCLAKRGWCVVSGLALGIDGAAHRGALGSQGATIAVLGCGIDRIYPKSHETLAVQIVADGGLILSEYPPGVPPMPHLFPQRNRIIAGLSHGLVVVEAALKSGSLITAELAGQAGKVVMAMPGSIHSSHAKGCHAMIRSGAILVENALHIEEDCLPSLPPEQLSKLRQTPRVKADNAIATPPPIDSPSQAGILESMGFDPLSLEALAGRTRMNVDTLLAELTFLELDGWVSALPGQKWQRLR